jgi:N-acetylglucosaminyldiphosphoundecaprenol N-acetyl-beta-D-mannosaminyltransferase
MTTGQDKAIVEIDGQSINIATLDDAVSAALRLVAAGRSFTFFTLNMDHLAKRRSDASFRDAYQRATLISADGAPLVWLAFRQGVRLERTTGADLLLPLCAAAAEARVPVAFFGSSEESLSRAATRLVAMYPGLQIVHMEAPPQGFDPRSEAADAAGARIAASGAKLCFVALGAPKQEFFGDRMAAHHPGIGYLGIGAAIDFVSGSQVRAPKFFQRTGLEWLWRLGSNPRRLLLRYARCALTLASITAELRQRPQTRSSATIANG